MTDQMPPSPEGLLLPGLDGSNPLGFLAALGTLRTMCSGGSGETIGMAWHCSRGVWCPQLDPCLRKTEAFIEHLDAMLRMSDSSPWSLHKKLPFEADRLRNAADDAIQVATKDERQAVDMLAALGSETVRSEDGVFADTALRMVRAGDSAGQGLLAYGKRIRKETTREDIYEALFATWSHQDDHCALRWDPIESRNYAFRWTDPSKEKTGSVRGANRLALEAMPLLPVVPVGQRVVTIGFGRFYRRTESITWPIWSGYASLDVVRSLMVLGDLQCERPNAEQLQRRGVAAVFRSDRVKTSKYYYNFTPARRIA